MQCEAYERACEVVPGTRQALAEALDAIMTFPDQDAAWSFSTLTCSGAPVEMAFASYDPDPRYTVEFGGPDVAPHDRLHNIQAFLGQAEPLVEWTATAAPRWGAWLGIRGETFKIYAEAPAAASLYSDYLEPVPLGASCIMLGHQPGSRRREFYFECPGQLSASAVGQLLGHVDMGDRQPQLIELMLQCVVGGGETLPRVPYGFSYSVLPNARGPALSVFVNAADFIGGDGFVRHQLLSVARARGWQLGGYPELTAPLKREFRSAIYHNSIGFVVSGAPEVGLHVSISPPPAPA
jgi:hypothetical protein